MKPPYFISGETTLEEANAAVHNDAGILVVVDAEKKLLGVVTPGDITNAKTRGLPDAAQARTFMNRKPKTAAAGKNRKAYLDLLRKWKVRQLPVVDRSRRVLDLVHIYEQMNPTATSVAAFWERYAINWKFGQKEHGRKQLGYEWFTDNATDDVIQKRLDDMVRTRLAPHITRKMKILEIGCGGARIASRVAPLCKSYTGIDASKQMLKIAAEELKKRNVSNIRLLLTDGYSIPLPDASFNLVFSYDVFVHFHIHLAVRYLQESLRVLIPGERAILHFAQVTTAQTADHLITEASRRIERPPIAAGDLIEYTNPETVRQVAERIGFEVQDIQSEEARFWIYATKPLR